MVALMLESSAPAANKYKVLHNFLNKPASFPKAALVSDSAGNLYGTAGSSSTGCQCGAVFKLTRESGGRWSYNVIHLFKGPDGKNPVGSLIFDSLGNLYGTTQQGGAYDEGVVFKLSQSSNNWIESVVHSFDGVHGGGPIAGLILDGRGVIYGTAGFGGVNGGVVFSIAPGWLTSACTREGLN
jgi:uncharacterized repeat protein (TIGR03803 family)